MRKSIKHNVFEVSNKQLVKVDFKHIVFEQNNKNYIVTLIDNQKHPILNGYGKSIVGAINDLHSNLI